MLRGLDIGGAAKTLILAIWKDLRAKRLWPVAIGLLVGIVAVPVLLSRASTPAAGAAAVPATPLPAPPPGMPAVTQRLVPPSDLNASPRDPFRPQVSNPSSTSSGSSGTSTSVGDTIAASGGPTTTTGGISPAGPIIPAGTSTTSSGSGSSSSAGGSSEGTGSDSSGGSGSSGSSSGSGSGGNSGATDLGPRQSYAVKLAITNSSGGINTLDPLERLSVLPSQLHPLLVELGVLKGGGDVLFAVEPGSRVSGPGQCIPGPIDCQILALGTNQMEKVAVTSSTGTSPVAMFAVTGISVVTHSSVEAANRSRRAESAAGRWLLNQSPLSALSLFPYQPRLGVVLDLRNLTFGGTS